ncbi:hypothetical protein GCM10027186_27270 [Micromonospora schwarzwaldensis]
MPSGAQAAEGDGATWAAGRSGGVGSGSTRDGVAAQPASSTTPASPPIRPTPRRIRRSSHPIVRPVAHHLPVIMRLAAAIVRFVAASLMIDRGREGEARVGGAAHTVGPGVAGRCAAHRLDGTTAYLIQRG